MNAKRSLAVEWYSLTSANKPYMYILTTNKEINCTVLFELLLEPILDTFLQTLHAS